MHGSYACAKKTAEVMRLLITTQRHPDATALIEDVRTVGTKLQAAKPVGESPSVAVLLQGGVVGLSTRCVVEGKAQLQTSQSNWHKG